MRKLRSNPRCSEKKSSNKVEDRLCDAHKGVLSGMHALPREDFKKKVGQEDESEEKGDVVQGAPRGLVAQDCSRDDGAGSPCCIWA